MFLSRLNEISGDCERIVLQCYIPKLPRVYVMFGHNGAGGRAADEPKDNSVKRSTKVVPPHKGDIVAFQNIERIWRSSRKCWC